MLDISLSTILVNVVILILVLRVLDRLRETKALIAARDLAVTEASEKNCTASAQDDVSLHDHDSQGCDKHDYDAHDEATGAQDVDTVSEPKKDI
jgi:hypothetical protein